MIKVKITQIEYDTDGENVDLPSELIIEVPFNKYCPELYEYVSDYISNETGYCHNGFSLSLL